MNMLEKEILDRIEKVSIDCPDCDYLMEDDQYTCTTCWCTGGNGRLGVLEWIKNHKNLI
jgi:hypothetical protein